MPDEDGHQKTADVPDTPLHAYKEGREDDVEPGSRGVTGDQSQGDEDSYQDGGHDSETEAGETPAPTGHQAAAGAHTGTGTGAEDAGASDTDAV